MHPLLRAAACKGNLKALHFLLDSEEDAQPSQSRTSPALELLYKQREAYNKMQRASLDVEEGANMQAPSDASSLQRGVTVQGDTALHVVAASGDGNNYLKCATFIYKKDESFLSMQNDSEEVSFLFKQNIEHDTPLHLAARAGNKNMVIHLIDLAKGDNNDMDRVKSLLRMENESKETALHDAVRVGDDDLVKDLLKNDPELTRFPTKGSSAMYLAVSLGNNDIAKTLHDQDNGLSYLGPKGQNALHAAVLRGSVLTRMLLEWNADLAAGSDENGSTPLHFAAPRIRCGQILKANSAALYQPDHQGSFPIHVAASVGQRWNVATFVKMCPSSAGLRDGRGRTFVHVAVDKREVAVVNYACRTRSLAWILNMQDSDGNTALHLAVQTTSLTLFCPLFGNQNVNLNLTNKDGQTSLDVAKCKIHPGGMVSTQNSEACILRALVAADAMSGLTREDKFQQNHKDSFCCPQSDYERKEMELIKDMTQSLCIGSVLIATVTFATAFALPGGYKADTSTNGGRPTLAGRYAFDAFMMANTLAFVFSSMTTVGLIHSGNPVHNLSSRKVYAGTAYYLMQLSVTCLIAAFSLGVYAVIGSAAHKTAVAICVLSPLVVVFNNSEHWFKLALLVLPYRRRMGLLWVVRSHACIFLVSIIFPFWPLLIIFLSAARGRDHLVHGQ